MPQYLNDPYWLAIAWPIVAAPCILAAIAALGAIYFVRSADWIRICGSVFGFALLGAVTGFLTGLSGDSVVLQAVLPAVLSVVGGLAAFLVSRNPTISDIVVPSIGALAFAVLLGSLWGSNERDANELARNSLPYLQAQAAQEQILRDKRKNWFHVPETPPTLPIPAPADVEATMKQFSAQ